MIVIQYELWCTYLYLFGLCKNNSRYIVFLDSRNILMYIQMFEHFVDVYNAGQKYPNICDDNCRSWFFAVSDQLDFCHSSRINLIRASGVLTGWEQA